MIYRNNGRPINPDSTTIFPYSTEKKKSQNDVVMFSYNIPDL